MKSDSETAKQNNARRNPAASPTGSGFICRLGHPSRRRPAPATRTDPFQAGNFLVDMESNQTSPFSEVPGLEFAIEVVD
jgi:hypothetical protein